MSKQGVPDDERAREQHLRKAFASIERVANRLDFDIADINLAESTYKQQLEERNKPIDDIEDNAMACLYIGAKLNGHPITPDDIVEPEPVTTDRKSLLRRSKHITSTLSLDFQGFHDINSFVDRISDNLALDDSLISRAHEIVDTCEEAGITGGKKPAAVAAAAIYNAGLEDSNVKLTQQEVSGAADVTEVTIRSRYQEQREILD
jgi:transcription initiation factor TFIIB